MFDLKKERWEKEFFRGWQVKSDYGVHPSTARKLRKEGALVGRDLKDENGRVYETIYLASENQKFLNNCSKVKK